MEAFSLAHARLLAASHDLGRISQFDQGYAVNGHLAEHIPDDSIGRMLSPLEARTILKDLKYGQRNYASAGSSAIVAIDRCHKPPAVTHDSERGFGFDITPVSSKGSSAHPSSGSTSWNLV
jgi:hypothetical protein